VTDSIKGMTPEEKIEFLGGQVHALSAICIALIYDHSNPERFGRWLDVTEQAMLARIESTLLDEEYLEGFQEMIAKMKQTLANVKARLTPQSSPPQE
jgi:hypothetical protein